MGPKSWPSYHNLTSEGTSAELILILEGALALLLPHAKNA